jgi:hypothetical protein
VRRLVALIAAGAALSLGVGFWGAQAASVSWPNDPCKLLSRKQVRTLLAGIKPTAGRVVDPSKSDKNAQCSWAPRNGSASVVLFGNANASPHASSLYACKHGKKVAHVGSFALYCPLPKTSPSFEAQKGNIELTITVVPHGKAPSETQLQAAAAYALARV